MPSSGCLALLQYRTKQTVDRRSATEVSNMYKDVKTSEAKLERWKAVKQAPEKILQRNIVYRKFRRSLFKPPLGLFNSGEPSIMLFDREPALDIVADCFEQTQMTTVVVVTAMQGMGKTAFLQEIADPERKRKAAALLRSSKAARVLCIDGRDYVDCRPSDFWQIAIAVHASHIFDGCQVDGYAFAKLDPAGLIERGIDFLNEQPHEHKWVREVLNATRRTALDMLCRLTDSVFSSDADVIALIDNGQELCRLPPGVKEGRGSGEHLLLHNVLKNAPALLKVVVAGTFVPKLNTIPDATNSYVTTSISLNALSLHWAFRVGDNIALSRWGDECKARELNIRLLHLIVSLTRIPQMIAADGSCLCTTDTNGGFKRWLKIAARYYENEGSLSQLESVVGPSRWVETACWIVAATTARWPVSDPYRTIPGTTLSWAKAQQIGLVFRSDTQFSMQTFAYYGCSEEHRARISSCFKKMFGVPAKTVLFNLEEWQTITSCISFGGSMYEDLFAAGVVLRWHLLAVKKPLVAPDGFPLHEVLLDDGLSEFADGKLRVCLKEGVHFASETEEATVVNSVGNRIFSNTHGKAYPHHHLVLPTLNGQTSVAVQCWRGGMQQEAEIEKKLKTKEGDDCYLLSVSSEHKPVTREGPVLVKAMEARRLCEIGATGALNPELVLTLRALRAGDCLDLDKDVFRMYTLTEF